MSEADAGPKPAASVKMEREFYQLKEQVSQVSLQHLQVDDKMLLRYLKASAGSVDLAFDKILSTNKWRGEFGVSRLHDQTPGVVRMR